MKIAVLGTSCIDRVIVPRLSNTFDFVKTTQVKEIEGFGGSMHNIAYHLGVLGVRTDFYTKIGSDPRSQMLVMDLENNGVRVRASVVQGKCPSFTCLEDENGKIYLSTVDERYFFSENDQLRSELFNDVAFGITDNNHPVFFKHLMEISSGTKWVMNARKIPFEWMNCLDGYILNREEASRYSFESLDAFASHCLKSGLNWLIITLDKDGLVYYDKDKKRHFPALTNGKGISLGCGDALSAGIMYGRSLGLSIIDSIPFGLKAASIIYSKSTAISKEIVQIKNLMV